MQKEAVLAEFDRLSFYLHETGRLENPADYRRNFSAFLSFATRFQAYRLAMPYCAGGRVLDVGCFIGYGVKILAPAAAEVVGIDTDVEALETARKDCHFPNVWFKEADARRLDFPEESFEVVTAFQVIEHMPVREAHLFLRELRRITARDGLLILTTPNRVFRLLPFQRPFNREHYQEFTAKGFRSVLQSVYDEVRIEGIRAQGWIEEIEKKRVARSPSRVYLRTPILRLFTSVVGKKTRDRLREYRASYRSFGETEEMVEDDNEFEAFFHLFSMADFYLTGEDLDRSIDLFAVCQKR